MDIFESIRRGYQALGLGADADVLDMLDQSGSEPACWEVHPLGILGRSRPADEVAALDLFERLPAQYELVRVLVRTWSPSERHARLVVGGRYRVRIRGTWEAFELPFTHIWSFANGRVKDVLNLTEGFELRRLPECASCATQRAPWARCPHALADRSLPPADGRGGTSHGSA